MVKKYDEMTVKEILEFLPPEKLASKKKNSFGQSRGVRRVHYLLPQKAFEKICLEFEKAQFISNRENGIPNYYTLNSDEGEKKIFSVDRKHVFQDTEYRKKHVTEINKIQKNFVGENAFTKDCYEFLWVPAYFYETLHEKKLKECEKSMLANQRPHSPILPSTISSESASKDDECSSLPVSGIDSTAGPSLPSILQSAEYSESDSEDDEYSLTLAEQSQRDSTAGPSFPSILQSAEYSESDSEDDEYSLTLAEQSQRDSTAGPSLPSILQSISSESASKDDECPPPLAKKSRIDSTAGPSLPSTQPKPLTPQIVIDSIPRELYRQCARNMWYQMVEGFKSLKKQLHTANTEIKNLTKQLQDEKRKNDGKTNIEALFPDPNNLHTSNAEGLNQHPNTTPNRSTP